ncbi:MAG: hypothetical protein LBU90_00645 [Bacteroidales bacterium]|jgi:hypothetical protein|nr:hypothetical protein [Bacteroidales bacterium]
MKQIFYVPSKGTQSWQELLADPEKHWKTGYSARTMAYCWEDNEGFPEEFECAFEKSKIDQPEIILALPEFKVDLDTAKRPSQNDLFVLAKDNSGLVVIMVEGKVEEAFDKTIKEWQEQESAGKKKRFEYLLKQLQLEARKDKDYDSYYYQLFHRTVSAVKTAKQFGTKKAMMIVHSFSQKYKHFDAYENFTKLFINEGNIEYDKIYYCKQIDGIDLYLGWIVGDKNYLNC